MEDFNPVMPGLFYPTQESGAPKKIFQAHGAVLLGGLDPLPVFIPNPVQLLLQLRTILHQSHQVLIHEVPEPELL